MISERNCLFIDLEVIPGCPWYMDEQANKVQPPSTYTKPDTIAKWMEEKGPAKRQEAMHATGLIPLYGQIVAIGYAINEGPVECLVDDNEGDLIRKFFDTLKAQELIHFRYVGHNVINFDLPYLWTRCMVNNIESIYRPDRNYKAWDTSQVVDTMTVIAGRDYKGHSLGNVSRVLGIVQPQDDMDGSQVWAEWQAGNVERIREYCMQDVSLTRDVYRRLERFIDAI